MPRMFRFVVALFCLTLLVSTLPSVAGAYTVQTGDTPSSIAKKHGISVKDLLKANKSLNPNKMQVGETLSIPGSAGTKDEKKHPEKEARPEKGSSKKASSSEAREQATAKSKDHKTSAAKEASHVVKKGETLGAIASKLGVSVDDLVKANKGLDPRKLKVGQKLTAPGAAAAEKVSEPAEKPSRKTAKASAPQEPTTTYRARHRDTPHSVARKFHISVTELARLNPDMGKKLHSGQKLTVPAGPSSSRRTAEELPSPEAEPEAAPVQTAPIQAAPTAPTAQTPPPVPPAGPAVAAVQPPKAAETAAPTLPDTKESAEAERYFEKGIEFGKQNKFQKAVENFDKAIKLNPNRADYYASRGHANYYMKQYAKAIDDYTRALEKNPNFALAYSMRGLSRTRSGHYPQAIEDFNRAIALGPNEADYYKGRGFTYLHLKQSGPMCQDYKKACDLGDCELLESARKEKACP